MLVKECIVKALERTDFEIKLSVMADDRESYEAYSKVKEKLEETLRIITDKRIY